MSTKGYETRASSLWKMTLSEEDPPKRSAQGHPPYGRSQTILFPVLLRCARRHPATSETCTFQSIAAERTLAFSLSLWAATKLHTSGGRDKTQKDAEVLRLHYCCYYYDRVPLESHGSLSRCLTLLLKKILSAYLNYPMMHCVSSGSNIFHDDDAPLH